MEPHARRRRCLVLGPAALVLALGLTACSGDDPEEQPAAQPDSSSGPSDPGATTDEAGNPTVTYRDLPDGFPLDRVPLDEGEVTSASVSTYDLLTAYTVLVSSDTDPTDAVVGAGRTLLDAGLTGDAAEPREDGSLPLLSYRSDDEDVVVVVSGASSGDSTVVTYTVEVTA